MNHRHLPRTLLPALWWSLCGCFASYVEPDPMAVPPLEWMAPERREDVRRILEAELVVILIPRTEVVSRLELYDFLMEELPFTAGVVRALEKGKYDIFREAPRSEDGIQERARRERTYYLNDGEGMNLAAELIFHEAGKWVYYVWGKYSFLFGIPVRGRAVIVVTADPVGETLATQARVYVPIAEAAGGVVEGIVRRKAGIFVEAAKTVAEAAAEDLDGLIRGVRESPEVDGEVLKIFEERFLRE